MNPNETPDFYEESRSAIREWQAGTLTFDEARRKLQSLIQTAQAINDPVNQGQMHLTMSYLFSMRGRHEHALGWARNAERLFKQANDISQLAGIYITQGEIYRMMNDYGRASSMFQQAYDAAHETGEVANQLFARGNEGHVALAQGRYEKAINLYTEALTMLEPFLEQETWLASPKAVKCEYQTALAEALFRTKDYESSWKNVAETFELAKHIEKGIEVAKVNHTLGKLIAGGNIPAAYTQFGEDFKPYFEEGSKILKDLGADLDYALLCADYADCLAQAGQKVAAKVQYQLAISLYSSLGMYAQVRQVTQRVNNLMV